MAGGNMLRIASFGALVLLAAAPAEQKLPVDIGGRVVAEPGGALRFGWPGVYFESRFRGTGVTVALDAGEERFNLMIDGHARRILTRADGPRVAITGLAPGEHVVRLEKRTESQTGSARFLGFFVTGKGRALPAPMRMRRIEFIGDSLTVGYGNTSPMRICTKAEIHDTTDTQRAFGPLVAKRLDAEYRVIAYSGHGVVRNYDGSEPGDDMPKRYVRAIPGEAAPVRVDGWRPDLIVINLGSNDFSRPLHPGEAWPDEAALRADYRAQYLAFARRLRVAQPQARLLLLGTDTFYGEVARVAAELGGHVATLKLPPLERTGCDWHPDLADHRLMADRVEAAIKVVPR